jgi:hypothetical protein
MVPERHQAEGAAAISGSSPAMASNTLSIQSRRPAKASTAETQTRALDLMITGKLQHNGIAVDSRPARRRECIDKADNLSSLLTPQRQMLQRGAGDYAPRKRSFS